MTCWYDSGMKKLSLLSFCLLFSLPAFSGFKAKKVYQLEALARIKGKQSYLLINPETNNQQYLKVLSKNTLHEGVAYRVCVQLKNDCDLECSVDLIGKPKVLGPLKTIAEFDVNSKGEYPDVDIKSCSR